MNTKFLLSPAYLVSVAALIVGLILSRTHLMVIGWIVFIVGLALNAMALVVLANREYLHRAQRVGIVPKASSHQGAAESQTATADVQPEETEVSDETPAGGLSTQSEVEQAEQSQAIFPHQK